MSDEQWKRIDQKLEEADKKLSSLQTQLTLVLIWSMLTTFFLMIAFSRIIK